MSEDHSEDSLEYPASDEAYRVEFANADGEPSTTIVKAVAAILGRKQDELDPLYHVIEPDALDSIFQPTGRGDRDGDVEVTFTYQGFTVAVKSYGVVEIEPTENRTKADDASE